MFTYALLGATYGFAAVVQPGPLQAYLLSQAAAHGWRRTLPAALSPLLSDGPVILITALILSRVPGWLAQWLRVAGGVFVLYLAWQAWRAGRRRAALQPVSAPRTLLQATAVNLFNPNPWISWSLVLGPLLVAAWRETPANGLALLSGFYGVMVVGLAATILLFGIAGKLGPGVNRVLAVVSAAALTVFGGYLLWSAATLP